MKAKFFLFLFFSVSFFPQTIFSEIFTTDSIDVFQNYINYLFHEDQTGGKKTLVVFDLDETLINSDEEPQEENTLKRFNELKDTTECKILGLTSRFASIQDDTIKSLNKSGFFFDEFREFDDFFRGKSLTRLTPFSSTLDELSREKFNFFLDSSFIGKYIHLDVRVHPQDKDKYTLSYLKASLENKKNYILYNPYEIYPELLGELPEEKIPHFEFTLFPNEEEFSARSKCFPLAYQNGVIFTSSMNKGRVLKFFLRKAALKFERIIFLDDSRVNIDELDKAFKEEPEEIHAVHLTL